MPEILATIRLVSRRVVEFTWRIWLPLFLTEVIPLPTRRRLALRSRLRGGPSDPQGLRARNLKVWVVFSLFGIVTGALPPGVRYLTRVLMASLLILGPGAELLRSLHHVRRYGPPVRSAFGPRLSEQFVHMLTLSLAEPESFGVLSSYCDVPQFYPDRMFLPENRRWAHLYLTGFPVAAVAANHLAMKAEAIAPGHPRRRFSKVWTYELLQKADIPTIEVLALAGRGGLELLGEREALPRADLFEKPNVGQGGDGARRWMYSEGQYQSNAGLSLSAEEFSEYLRRNENWVVVQACMENHPLLFEISGRTLSTLRVYTLLDGSFTPRVLPNAFLKMPKGTAVADNLHFGSLGAPVDVTSGALGPSLTNDFSRVSRHPTTGVWFEGVVMPFWKDVLDLAARAHHALVPAVVLGFDIAVLPDGPVIVEVNSAPISSDHVTGIPMARIEELDQLLGHLNRLVSGDTDRSNRPDPLRKR